MGTGWRRAFCTTFPRDRDDTVAIEKQQEQSCLSPSPSPRTCGKFGFFKTGGGSNPSSPSLRCKTTIEPTANENQHQLFGTPRLRCKTTSNKTPKPSLPSNPASPRSPFSVFKNTLRLSRHSCGVCMQSVKTGQKMAIYTAECSHTFHFPCIASHVKKQTTLLCPVCNSPWKHVPLLTIHNQQQTTKQDDKLIVKPAKIKQKVTTSYNDDEPLLTPRAGAGVFVPIPEVNENDQVDDEDEVEEFKGFFVNPVSSSLADESLINGRDYRDVEVNLLPEAVIVSSGQTHETHVVVLKVKAPPPPVKPTGTTSRRAPIDLVTVLDVSASMGGAKLSMLKRAMRLVISSLGSADRLSIVAFAASPKRLLPLRRMTVRGQRSARRIIDRLVCSQGSSAGVALRKATKVLEDRRERNPVASIILLSDGHDEHVNDSNSNNHGQAQTHVSSTRFAHVEIPVHAFGYGEPAENAFTKCVGGLLSVVVQDLRIQLGFASGSDPAQISAVYSCNGRPTTLNSGSIRLGDLYAEQEREILVEMKVPKSKSGSHHVLSVRCCYNDPASLETICGGEKALLVPRAQAIRSSSSPRIERLRNLFIATRAVAESRQLVEHNELTTAQHLLSSARALVMQSMSISAEEYVHSLEAELAEIQWRRLYQQQLEHRIKSHNNEREVGVILDENSEPLTPTSAWRTADKLAKVAVMKKSLNRVSDLHGFENARF